MAARWGEYIWFLGPDSCTYCIQFKIDIFFSLLLKATGNRGFFIWRMPVTVLLWPALFRRRGP
ncbi:hypothetical protein D1BOALGB6SA_5703 [Olavius sp. associated proteobacterium Delta 1]|nr:hypothetical protein D1BOALGB6SA_5703 [Olavius sp. associated proteobacterium Delta 1]